MLEGHQPRLRRAPDAVQQRQSDADGDALFVNPSSLAVPLVALGAKATIVGPNGERTVKVEELYQVPKKDGDRELTLARGEVLTKVTVPAARGKNASYEARQKQAHDWPLVLASVNLTMDGDKVSQARVVLGGVAPIPLRSEAAEQAIAGKAITEQTATDAGHKVTAATVRKAVLLAAALVAMVFSGISNGIALLVRREATMIAAANFVGLPLMFLSSILIQRQVMPSWMQSLAHYNPVDWGVRASRDAVVYGGHWTAVGFYMLLLIAATAMTAAFATWTFRSYQRSI